MEEGTHRNITEAGVRQTPNGERLKKSIEKISKECQALASLGHSTRSTVFDVSSEVICQAEDSARAEF
jgi:hypothetical protein